MVEPVVLLEVTVVIDGPVSPTPRIVIPGNASLPALGVVLVLSLLVLALEVDDELPEFTTPATVLVLLDPPRTPGSVPGELRFGLGEIANCPRASPGGTTTV